MSEKASRNWFAGKGFPQVICWLLYAVSFFWGLVILLSYVSQDAQKGVTPVTLFWICGLLYMVSPFLMSVCTRKYETAALNKVLPFGACIVACANIVVAVLMFLQAYEPASACIISGVVGVLCMPVSLALHILCLGLFKK